MYVLHNLGGVIIDILLERILSLIPRKPDGKYVHGAKKTFCERIGAPTNIISEWETGKTKSYRNYVHAVAMAYGVSVEWLKGETEQKETSPVRDDTELIPGYADLTEDEKRKVSDYIDLLLAARHRE